MKKLLAILLLIPLAARAGTLEGAFDDWWGAQLAPSSGFTNTDSMALWLDKSDLYAGMITQWTSRVAGRLATNTSEATCPTGEVCSAGGYEAWFNGLQLKTNFWTFASIGGATNTLIVMTMTKTSATSKVVGLAQSSQANYYSPLWYGSGIFNLWGGTRSDMPANTMLGRNMIAVHQQGISATNRLTIFYTNGFVWLQRTNTIAPTVALDQFGWRSGDIANMRVEDVRVWTNRYMDTNEVISIMNEINEGFGAARVW